MIGDKGDVRSEAGKVRVGTEVEASEHDLVGRVLAGVNPEVITEGTLRKGKGHISPRDGEDALLGIFGGIDMAHGNDVLDAEEKSGGRGPEAGVVKLAAEVSAKDPGGDVEGARGGDEARERRGGVVLLREQGGLDGTGADRPAYSNVEAVARPSEGRRIERSLNVDLGRNGGGSSGSDVRDEARVVASVGEGATMPTHGVSRGAAGPTKEAAVETTRGADRGKTVV